MVEDFDCPGCDTISWAYFLTFSVKTYIIVHSEGACTGSKHITAHKTMQSSL